MASSTKVANYTKLNLRGEVEDQAPKFGMSPDMEYRPARAELDLENSGVSFFRLDRTSASRSGTRTTSRRRSTSSSTAARA